LATVKTIGRLEIFEVDIAVNLALSQIKRREYAHCSGRFGQ
jgi:hypothetical protein